MSQSIPQILSEQASRQAITVLSIGHFSIDFWQGCFPAITALLAVGRGYSYTTVGILVLAFNLASSMIQPVFGRIADKRSAQWLMAFGLSIAGIGVTLIGILRNELLLCLSAMMAGVGVAAFHPEAARLVRAASTGNYATSMSFFSTGRAHRLLLWTTPGELAADKIGVEMVRYFCSCLMLSWFGFCLYAPFSVMVVLGQEYVPNHVGLVSGIVFRTLVRRSAELLHLCSGGLPTVMAYRPCSLE